MQPSTQVLLTVADAANELSIQPIEVARLISKRKITATRMGATGAWRITPDSLTRYVQSGAPDLRLPDWSPVGAAGWYDGAATWIASQFESALRGAAAEQQPSDAKLEAAFTANPDALTIKYSIAMTGAVARLCTQAPPVSVTPPGNSVTPSVFTQWADYYGVDQLRIQAAIALADEYPGEPAFDALFDSPERFAAVTSSAFASVKKRNVSYSHCLPMTGPKFGSAPVVRRASFVFPLSNLLTAGRKAQLLDLAF